MNGVPQFSKQLPHLSHLKGAEERMRLIEVLTSASGAFVTTRFVRSEEGISVHMPRLMFSMPPDDMNIRRGALEQLALELDAHFLPAGFIHGDLNRKNIRWCGNGYVVLDFEPWLVDPVTQRMRCTFPYLHAGDFDSGMPSPETDLLGWYFFVLSQLDPTFRRPVSVAEANRSEVRWCCAQGTFRSVLSLAVEVIPSGLGTGTPYLDC